MSLLGKTNGGPTVGIDIGSSLIKVVEAKPGRDGIQVTALGVAPTPPGAIENEVIVEPQALGEAIRQLLIESGASSRRSVSSVSGQSSVVVRIIEVPMTAQSLDDNARKELAATMKWEVERHVPFSSAESLMDYQPIERPQGGDGQNLEVLLAVARQELINSHVDALMAAKLDPAAIEVEAVATCRAVLDLENPSERTVAILNIGSAATELGVYMDGLLALPRTLPLAGETITRAISDTCGVSMEDAEKVKREKAVILLDRMNSMSGQMSLSSMGGFDDSEPTMDIGRANNASAGLGVLSGGDDSPADFGFIPGLGFSGQPETAEPAAPEFDIEMPGAGGFPTMDFDMDLDGGAARQAFALEETAGDTGGSMLGGGADASGLTAEQVFDAMAPVLMDLVNEVRRSLEYFATKFQAHPEKIILCGGTSKIKGLDQMMQTELGIPATVANPFQKVTVLSSSVSPEYLEEIAPVIPVSLGLAVRDLIGG